jgi:hypothetical protein
MPTYQPRRQTLRLRFLQVETLENRVLLSGKSVLGSVDQFLAPTVTVQLDAVVDNPDVAIIQQLGPSGATQDDSAPSTPIGDSVRNQPTIPANDYNHAGVTDSGLGNRWMRPDQGTGSEESPARSNHSPKGNGSGESAGSKLNPGAPGIAVTSDLSASVVALDNSVVTILPGGAGNGNGNGNGNGHGNGNGSGDGSGNSGANGNSGGNGNTDCNGTFSGDSGNNRSDPDTGSISNNGSGPSAPPTPPADDSPVKISVALASLEGFKHVLAENESANVAQTNYKGTHDGQASDAPGVAAEVQEGIKGGSVGDIQTDAGLEVVQNTLTPETQPEVQTELADNLAEVPAPKVICTPLHSDLLGTTAAVNWHALEEGVSRFFEKVDQLGWQLIGVAEPSKLTPWLVTVAAAGLTLEIARRHRHLAVDDLAAECPHLEWTWPLSMDDPST